MPYTKGVNATNTFEKKLTTFSKCNNNNIKKNAYVNKSILFLSEPLLIATPSSFNIIIYPILLYHIMIIMQTKMEMQ